MRKYRLGIFDDHLLFSEAIAGILRTNPDYEVCFITNSLDTVLYQININQIDLIILDINIPPYNGLELISQFKEICPELKILILTMYQPCDINLDFKLFKGDGYVLKTSEKSILEESISAIINGNTYIDFGVIKFNKKDSNNSDKSKLSKRELEIAKLVVAGKTTKKIAAELFISELTVNTHRKNIAQKLDSEGATDFINKVTQALNKIFSK